MSRGGFGGVNDFFLRHVRPAVAEIVADRVVEENRFLGDDGHLLAQGPQRDVVDRVAVDAHLAGGDLVETRQEIHEGGFSSATGTDDGHDSSRGNLHIDILQDQSVVIVSESDAIEFNGPGKRRQRLRSGQLHRFTRQIDEGEDLLGDSGGLKEKLVHVAEAFDWLVGLEERVGERYEQTHAHATGLDFAASEKQNERNHDGTEQIHDRRSGGERANPTHVFVQQLARGLTEFADFEAFHAEGLHDAIAGDRFLENLAQVRERLFSDERRILRPNLLIGHTTNGIRTAEPSAMRQLMTSRTAINATSAKHWRNPSATQSENALRICSISAITADITRPTGLCWKNPMGCWTTCS